MNLQRILAAVGGIALVTLLGASASTTIEGETQVPGGTSTGLRLSDLPISRSFHAYGIAAQTMQFPTDAGIIITEIGATSNNVINMTLIVDNTIVALIYTRPDLGRPKYRFDPPLLVPPGSSLTVNATQAWNLNGYRIYDTDL